MVRAAQWTLSQCGVLVEGERPPVASTIQLSSGRCHTHECRGGIIEEHWPGVPVFQMLTVPKVHGGTITSCVKIGGYWSGPVRLYHEGDKPESSLWRMLILPEAVGFLGENPEYGACRYDRGEGDIWEVFINPVGKMQTWPGLTNVGHHAAYTNNLLPDYAFRETFQ
ncbi:hypothetical protein A2881_05400 [Candidatus Peribacteria bacterium RIFCSPHIGHO2_01_FULL_55_13]|nr:MAG: hypothetical protein A2881_05400 [Candidatus Peribacteria bacterium RIFCSPHIGHO2_01_FULL_55_13]OGJ66748.1 MAG: hypothetical protein A3F36_04540 [Candidatus Peribacteria bacterium RIFCSPHIGHO2_12_FULL_55_11]